MTSTGRRQQIEKRVQIDNAARLAVDFEDVVPAELRLNDETRKKLMTAKVLAFDFETSNDLPELNTSDYRRFIKRWGLSVHASVTFLGIAWGWGETDGVVFRAPFSEEDLAFLSELFARADVTWVAHNLPFDARLLGLHCGIPVPASTWDTLTAAFSMGKADKEYARLDTLCKAYEKVIPGDVTYTGEDKNGKATTQHYKAWIDYTRLARLKGGRDSLDLFDQKEIAWYVLADVRLTLRLYFAQHTWSAILEHQYGYTALPKVHDRDQRYIRTCATWAVRGEPIDRDYAIQLFNRTRSEMNDIVASLIPLGVGDLTKNFEIERFFFDIIGLERPVPDFDEAGNPVPKKGEERLWTPAMNYSFGKKAMPAWEQRIKARLAAQQDDDAGEALAEEHETAEEGNILIEHTLASAEGGQVVVRMEPGWWFGLYKYYKHLIAMHQQLRSYLAHAIQHEDGMWYIHPLLKIGTVTGRSAASDPNNLNVKVEAPYPMKVFDFATGEVVERMTISMRGVIIAPPGMELVEMDYSNAEKRMQTVLAQDIELARAIAQGKDLHSEFAKAYFKVEWDRIAQTCSCGGIYENGLCKEHKRLRQNGKAMTFGLDYGMGVRTAAMNLQISFDAAKAMIDGFNRVYWGLARFKRDAQKEGPITWAKMKSCEHPMFAKPYGTLYDGQRIPINPPRWDHVQQREKDESYKIINFRQQGGVAVMVKDVINAVNEWLVEGGYNSYLMQQVHDSLIVCTDPAEAAEVLPQIAWIMMTVVPFELSFVRDVFIPFPADADLTENKDKWGWRADGSYAFDPVGEKEGKGGAMRPVYATYGCDEDQVQAYIINNALVNGAEDAEALEILRDSMWEDGPTIEFVPWTREGKVAKRPWPGTKVSLAKYREMANKFHRSRQLGRVKGDWVELVDVFVKFVDDLLAVNQDLERRQKELVQATERLEALEAERG